MTLRIEAWFSVSVETTNIGAGGFCALLPGGAATGENYSVILRLPGDSETPGEVTVRWTGALDADGFAPVGLQWVGASPIDANALAALTGGDGGA